MYNRERSIPLFKIPYFYFQVLSILYCVSSDVLSVRPDCNIYMVFYIKKYRRLVWRVLHL